MCEQSSNNGQNGCSNQHEQERHKEYTSIHHPAKYVKTHEKIVTVTSKMLRRQMRGSEGTNHSTEHKVMKISYQIGTNTTWETYRVYATDKVARSTPIKVSPGICTHLTNFKIQLTSFIWIISNFSFSHSVTWVAHIWIHFGAFKHNKSIKDQKMHKAISNPIPHAMIRLLTLAYHICAGVWIGIV